MKDIKKLNVSKFEEASKEIRDLTNIQPKDEFFAAIEATQEKSDIDLTIEAWQSNLKYQEEQMETEIKKAIKDTQFEVDWDVNIDEMSKEEIKKTINIMHGFVKQHQHAVNNYNCNKNKEIDKLKDLLTEYLDNSTIRSNKKLCEALGYKWKGE